MTSDRSAANPVERPDAYFANDRHEVLAHLPVSGVQRVLSLGCASGATEARLKQERGLAQVVGVEFEPDVAAEAAGRLDAVHTGDIQTLELPYARGHFDAVLCLDVLEHLVDPWSALRERARPLLRSGGFLLVSVPNVQFWPVLARLFRGDWIYARSGVMDIGHLRFFTVRSAREMVTRAGFDVVRLERKYRLWEARGDRESLAVVSTAARRVGPTAWLRRLGFFHVLFFLRGFFTYQTIVLARKRDDDAPADDLPGG